MSLGDEKASIILKNHTCFCLRNVKLLQVYALGRLTDGGRTI